MFRFMVGLHKHPKSGVYYFRKAIPKKLRPAFGGRHEFLESLHTKDLAEANRKLPAVAAEFEAKLARARGDAVDLSHQQIAALVGEWYRGEIARWEANPGSETYWEETLDNLALDDHLESRAQAVWVELNELLDAKTLKVTDETRAAIVTQLFDAKVLLTQTILRRTRGDYGPDENLQRFPKWRPQDETTIVSSLTLSGLVADWASERKPPEKTRYSWDRILQSLANHLGHDDVNRITRKDIIHWKDAMLANGHAPATVKNKLTVASTIFRWAVANEKMASNPAERVRTNAQRSRTDLRQPYSDADARLVLAAAREQKGFLRWVPWILAFSGARLEEVCGASVDDIRQVAGIWCIDINEANTGKKNQASIRVVPLHPAVISEGFLEYVAAIPEGSPLFSDIKPDRFGRRSGNATKITGRWVRSLGITDKRKAPNHSWRHWFKDELRKAEVPHEAQDLIMGHKVPVIGGRYGRNYQPPQLARYIARVPSPLDVEQGDKAA